MPTWDQLGQKTSGTAGLRIAKVDCGQFDGLCNNQKVDGYPTLTLYKDGLKVKEYEDERTLEVMFDFVVEHLTVPEKDEL